METASVPDYPPTVPIAPDIVQRERAPALPGYEMLELLGAGGMGRVYRARHEGLGRIVAVKFLAREHDAKLLARFGDEARAVARLQHPNIVQLFEFGNHDGRPYFAQEFVAGGTLTRKLGGQPQEPRSAAQLVATLARAIQHSHEAGILHRDLKPGNVLVTADGVPKVTDFGLAKAISPIDAAASTATNVDGLTRTGEILGTPSYMPPEQAIGASGDIGPPADVYSLGAILYEALTGRPPFVSSQALQTLMMVVDMEPVPPRALVPKLPRDLETICLKCLEKSPAKRYSSARVLAEDLERFVNGAPIVARPVGTCERVIKWAKRRKAVTALLAVSLLLVLSVVVATIALAVGLARERRVNQELAQAKNDLQQSNADLLAAKTESDQSFQLAQSALERVVNRVSLRLNGVPRTEGLMIETFRESASFYRALCQLRPDDRAIVEGYAEALITLLSVERSYARKDAHQSTRSELLALLRSELTRTPDDERLRAVQVRAAYDDVLTAEAATEPKDLNVTRRHFIDLADRFLRQFPHHSAAGSLTVFRHWAAANEAGERTGNKERREALRIALAAARAHLTADPKNKSAFTMLVTTLSLLGMAEEVGKDFDAADRAFAEAERMHSEAGKDADDPLTHKVGLADMKSNRARVATRRRDNTAALEFYVEAEALQRQLVQLFPLDPFRRLELADSLSWLATLKRAAYPEEAKRHMLETIDIARELVKSHPENDTFRNQLEHWEKLWRQWEGVDGSKSKDR